MNNKTITKKSENTFSEIFKDWNLIQYSDGNKVFHRVLHRSDITDESESQCLLNDGKSFQIADKLSSKDSEFDLFDELRIYRDFCCKDLISSYEKQLLSGTNENNELAKDFWLLVQYSCGVNNVIYAMISSNDVIMGNENKINEYVVYITDGKIIYQGIILKKSLDKTEIEDCLKNIEKECLYKSISNKSQMIKLKSEMMKQDKSIEEINDVENKYNISKTFQELNSMLDNLKKGAITMRALTYALKKADILNGKMDERIAYLKGLPDKENSEANI